MVGQGIQPDYADGTSRTGDLIDPAITCYPTSHGCKRLGLGLLLFADHHQPAAWPTVFSDAPKIPVHRFS